MADIKTDMKASAGLDRIADALEAQGEPVLAMALDKISDGIERQSGMEKADDYTIALKILDKYQHEKYADTSDYSAYRRWLREHMGK